MGRPQSVSNAPTHPITDRVIALGKQLRQSLRSRAWSFPQPQEYEALAGIVNGVGGEVFLGNSRFVEHDPGQLSTVTTRRSYFAPLDQSIDDRRGDIRIEPNQVGARRGRKVDPPRHTR